MNRRSSFAIGLISILVLAGCSDSDGPDAASSAPDGLPDTLSMGVGPLETITETAAQWDAYITAVEQALDVEIVLLEATESVGVIEAAIAGDLDIVHLGPFGQMLAFDNGAELVTVGATGPTPDGPNNAALGAVRADSDIEELADLEGRDVCFVSATSTTGYLFAAAALEGLGIDPEADINGVFVGDHANAVRQMLDGECDAAFSFREQIEVLTPQNEDGVEPEDLKVIFRQEVPEGGLTISKQLSEAAQERLAQALLDSNGTAIAEAEGCGNLPIEEHTDGSPYCRVIAGESWGLVAVDDTYWQPVRDVCEATNAPACDG